MTERRWAATMIALPRAGVVEDRAGEVENGDESCAVVGRLDRTPRRLLATEVRELSGKVVRQRPGAGPAGRERVEPRIEARAGWWVRAPVPLEVAGCKRLNTRQVGLESDARHRVYPVTLAVLHLRCAEDHRPGMLRTSVRPIGLVRRAVKVQVAVQTARDYRAREARLLLAAGVGCGIRVLEVPDLVAHRDVVGVLGPDRPRSRLTIRVRRRRGREHRMERVRLALAGEVDRI